MTERATPTISIITATYNAAEHLPRLIESLIAQTDQDFEWVVADGGSTDGTLEILEKAKLQLKKVVVDSRPDFGIYDALNRGVKILNGDYYLVLGADDQLLEYAIEKFKNTSTKRDFDLLSFRYFVGNRVAGVRKPSWEFLFSQFAYVSGHAVGLLIRSSLHKKIGLYSRRFPIAADQYFILSAIHAGAKVYSSDIVVGRFALGGFSHNDVIGALTESYRINLSFGCNIFIQTILLVIRIIKNSIRKK